MDMSKIVFLAADVSKFELLAARAQSVGAAKGYTFHVEELDGNRFLLARAPDVNNILASLEFRYGGFVWVGKSGFKRHGIDVSDLF